MRYVVAVKPPDDHPGAVRVMGTWSKRERAEQFCERVRSEVDLDSLDEHTGFAYVMPVERPRVKSALRWALRGER